MSIIIVNNLEKKYVNVEAVKSISFSVEEGEFVAFLGVNGAGKSTTINIVSTLLKKTAGIVKIDGNILDKDDDKIRKALGVVFQKPMLDDFLTVRENIQCRGQLYGLSNREIDDRIDDIKTKLGINQILNRRYGKLSGGQRRRADIARALIHNPKILIMDEPTTGLDPYTRESLWKFIEYLREQQNTTIFLTTHYMEEASQADRIIMIDKGEIIENDSPTNLKIKYSRDVLKVYPRKKSEIRDYFMDKEIEFKEETEYFNIHIKNHIQAVEILENLKNKIGGFEMIKGNMDQVFLALTTEEGKGENDG
ncbi:MAG: ABC transporter ATP-binding protein [Eubacteriales bacterium]